MVAELSTKGCQNRDGSSASPQRIGEFTIKSHWTDYKTAKQIVSVTEKMIDDRKMTWTFNRAVSGVCQISPF